MATIVPITNRCNQNCLFCSAKGRRGRIALDWLHDCINQEEEFVVISGGEPTLSKNLFKILSYVKNKNLKVELQTNGVTLSYFDLARRIAGYGIDLFNVNFPSHLEELSDKLTQTPGFFKKRLEGINNLIRLNTSIRLTHIVNSLNFKELENLVEFIKKELKQVNYIQFSFIKIQGNAKRNSWINPRYVDVQKFLLRALRKCRKYNINFMVDHIPLCYLPGFESYHVDFIKLEKGQEAVFSFQEKTKVSQCSKCRLNKDCYGVRKDYIELFGGKSILLEFKRRKKSV